MSTNRTKIDWTYKQAERVILLANSDHVASSSLKRKVAAILRRVERRGAKQGHALAQHFEPLTAATIRKCAKQLKAVALKPDVDGSITFQVLRQIDHLGGYSERCIHGQQLSKECTSCGKA